MAPVRRRLCVKSLTGRQRAVWVLLVAQLWVRKEKGGIDLLKDALTTSIPKRSARARAT